MAVYTQLKKSQINKIGNQFGLKLKTYTPNKGGACNSNFLIRTKDKKKYMFTLVEERTKKESAALSKLLLWLKKNQYPTTPLVKTINKKNFTLYKNKAVLIKKYLKGEVYEQLKPKHLRQVGQSLAELHKIPAPDFLPKYLYYEMPKFKEVIGPGIDPFYEKWLKKRLQYFKNKLPDDLPKGLIHADLFSDNILFKKNKLKAIIDFEEASNYTLIYDIGMTILGVCLDDGKIIKKKTQALIKGYQKIRQLKNKEIKHLQLFTQYAAVLTSSWRFWKYHIDAPNPERKNKHREMMGNAEMIREMPKRVFLKMMFE